MLLAFVSAASFGPALAHDPADDAVFVARVTGMVSLGESPCPPDHICLSSVYMMALERREHISGPIPEKDAAFILVQQGQFLNGVILRIRAREMKDGRWRIVERAFLEREEDAPVPVETIQVN